MNTTQSLLTFLFAITCSALLFSCSPLPTKNADQAEIISLPKDVEWDLYGNDSGEQRFSKLDQINTKTVGNLGLTWSFDMFTKRGMQATPLMLNKTIYTTSSWSIVYALDAITGELKWTYDPKVDRAFLAKGCCGAVNRGVAYANGKIYVAAYDGRLIALDAKSGELQWEVQTTDRTKSYTITGAPRIANDKVVIGNGGAELGVRGYVTAYDLDTGAQQWRFYTVPGNPEDGFESPAMEMAAKTWSGKWWEWGGGGTVWDSMVYDPELDLLYLGVGNGSPWNAKLRSPEGGDNLFLASIVAVNPNNGDYVWHYQTTPGETWDYTATQHMVLADLEIAGQPRKVLMQAPKNGFFYVLDRITGELLSAEKFTFANWASHVDMNTGRPVESKNSRLFDGKNVTIPSNAGAHNWPPMSFNHDTGLVYIPSMVVPITFLEPTNDVDTKPNQGLWNTGFDRNGNVPPPIPEAQLAEFIKGAVTGQLIAWDPITQSAKWATEPSRPSGGGVLSTAGDLVFQADGFGQFTAYNAASGDKLWSHDVQTSAMAAPMTHFIDGEQYIALSVGLGGGLTAEGGPIAHAWKMVNRSRLLVYKLGGTHQLPAIDTVPEVTMSKPSPVTASVAVVELGKAVYQRHCAYCHGDGMRTGGVNKDLRLASEGVHTIWQQIVRDGLLQDRGMVGFGEWITEAEAEAIRQYTLSLSNKLYTDTQTTESKK